MNSLKWYAVSLWLCSVLLNVIRTTHYSAMYGFFQWLGGINLELSSFVNWASGSVFQWGTLAGFILFGLGIGLNALRKS